LALTAERSECAAAAQGKRLPPLTDTCQRPMQHVQQMFCTVPYSSTSDSHQETEIPKLYTQTYDFSSNSKYCLQYFN